MRQGDVIAERFAIRRRAGAGGMGTVYEAFDTVARAPVAIKTWRAPFGRDDPERSRLWREARALAEIRHPAVVQYVDHGDSVEHGPFLAMSWVTGPTLAERLLSGGVSPRDALRLALRLGSGLAAVHARGVVHRDLKPSNIMLPDGDVDEAVIVDFGIARLSDASGITATGAHLGTPRYMAPEQIRSARTVDGRADVFALGCILFECLTGRPAFDGYDPVSVLARVLFEPLPIPSQLRPNLPAALDALLAALLARDIEKRPPAAALAELVAGAEASAGAALTALGAALHDRSDEDVADSTHFARTGWSSAPEPAPPSFQLGHNAILTAVRRAFPPQNGKFMGRDEEIARLTELLRDGTRIVTVWGGPGIGKTRLVLEGVRRIASDAGQSDAFSWDALVFADFSDARDADDIVRILAREAGVTLATSSAPEVALGRAFAKLGRVLVVADPAEHVITPLAAATHAFLRAAPGLQVLCTSRTRFCPPGAVALEIGPLATMSSVGPRWNPSQPAPTDAENTGANRRRVSAAAAMFLDRAGQWLPSIDRAGMTAADDVVEQAERLTAALEGIPLAIELCAARVHVLGLDGLLARIGAPATSDTPTIDGEHGPMAMALSGSWNLLRAAERSAFAQCAVFRGGFTIEAALAVIRVADGALELIQSLRDKSLLYSWSAASATEVRLSMFAPVRDFAWQKLRASGDLAGALRRHAAHFVEVHTPRAQSGMDAKSLARLERDAENLLAAAEWALSEEAERVGPAPPCAEGVRPAPPCAEGVRPNDLELGFSALLALEPAMLARGALGSFRTLLDRALLAADAAGAEDPAVLALGARVRQVKARLAAPSGQTRAARAELELCLREAERSGDDHWQATVWLDLGVAFHFERALPDARRCYETALELLRPSGDLGAEGRCIGNLGALHHDDGNLHQAARSYRQAVALLEQTGETRHRANFIANLAVLEQELGHADEARERYERSVALLEPLRDARVLAITLGNLGALELELRHRDRALALFQRSLALLAGSGDARSIALCQARMGAAFALLGRIGEAEAALFRADRFKSEIGALVAETVALVHAFVDLSCAHDAIRAGDRIGAARHRSAAQERVDRVSIAPSMERSLAQQSDDLRSFLRILEPALLELDGLLHSDDQGKPSQPG
jgi:predicted ATPase/tRNA A-37 threonylcarbamoyl transferase component Bud32/Tfp pilus assembly protein PilF